MNQGGDANSWYESSVWTNSPKHIVSAAVTAFDREGRILLVRSPRRGWEIPGGQVEFGESLEHAAIRETKEESGIDVGNLVFCGIFQSREKSIMNTLFRGDCLGGSVQTSEETLEVGFFAPREALALVSYDNFRQRIEYCLDRAMQPFFVCV